MKKPAQGRFFYGAKPVAYLAASTMYWIAALKSASDAAEPPLGGMAPMPLVAFCTMSSMPLAMNGAQAALSPNLGAPATPLPWQATQVVL